MRKRADPYYWEFGARIRALRTSLGLSQSEAAKRVGKPQSYFSKLESCEKRLDVIEALAICKALGVTLDVLLPQELSRLLVSKERTSKGPGTRKNRHG
jgi:transcriptional regulator with XRE-family HTH domain